MAMLLLNDVFDRTWGERAGLRPPTEYWREVVDAVKASHPAFLFMAEVYWDREWTMQQQGFDYAYDKRLYDRLREGHARPVREQVPGFCFMAEVYWDLEWELQQQGFDYTYDKRLYDRLREMHTGPVRDHFRAGLDFQYKSARFLENHDEPRAAATFPPEVHEAAAIVTFLSPGLRFFHQGQFEGRTKRISPHLVRAPEEPVDQRLVQFYDRLLVVLHESVARDGRWQLHECSPAWDGNWTSDCFLAYSWTGKDGAKCLVVVNYSGYQSQCFVAIPWPELEGHYWQLRDRMGTAFFERSGADLAAEGLYLDMSAWAYHVFDMHMVKTQV
jgi:hypothetical protein